MKCRFCGIDNLPVEAVFCPACGKKLEESKTAATPRLRLKCSVADTVELQPLSWWFKTLKAGLGISEYPLSLTPDLASGFRFFTPANLVEVDFSDFVPASKFSFDFTFKQCCGLKEIDLRPLNGTKVSSMNQSFYSATGLQTVHAGGLDLTACTNMEMCFKDCSALENLDLSGWKVQLPLNV